MIKIGHGSVRGGSRTLRSEAWILTTILVIAAPVFGAEVTTDAPGTDIAELDFDQLAAIKVAKVYGASLHEQNVTEAPSDVTIVTAEDIKQSGYRTLAEILNGARGFYTTSDGVYDYIGTRGFDRPGDYGGRFLIMIDGHRMNDDIFDSAAIGTEFLLDVDLIDRVEIIRGPGSSLYGNNAVFAVINVITRSGEDIHGAEVSGSYGSYDAYTGRITYGNRFKNGLELTLSGSYLDIGGNDGVYYPGFSDINHGYARRNDAASDPSGLAVIRYKELSLEGGFARRDETVPNGAYGTVFNDASSKVLDERAFADLRWIHEFDGDWELNSRIYYDHYRYNGDYPMPEFGYGDPNYPGIITLNEDRDLQESAGAEAQISKTLLERHRLTAGAQYMHDFTLSQRNFDAGGASYLNSDITQDTLGVFVQDEYSILRNLILNAGARYDYFSTFGSTANPRAALIYNPWTNSTFKLMYGQAFRAPNAYELYYVAPGYSSDQQLKPETIRSYELNLDQVLNSRLQLHSSLFYYQIHDLISFGTDSSGENSTFGNLAGANAWGGEVELDAQWAKGWRARLSYSYTDARDDSSGQWLSDSPHHLAKLNLTAPLWREKTFANLEILAMSGRKASDGRLLNGFAVANITLLSRQILRNLEFSASVYNLFDQKYSDPVSSDFPEDAVQQFGRSFRAKLTYRF